MICMIKRYKLKGAREFLVEDDKGTWIHLNDVEEEIQRRMREFVDKVILSVENIEWK